MLNRKYSTKTVSLLKEHSMCIIKQSIARDMDMEMLFCADIRHLLINYNV